jgi:hypothetical protein
MDGNVDAIIHAAPTNCGLIEFSDGTVDESIIVKWNTRAPSTVGVEAQVDRVYRAIYFANGCTINDGSAVRAAIRSTIASEKEGGKPNDLVAAVVKNLVSGLRKSANDRHSSGWNDALAAVIKNAEEYPNGRDVR